MQGIVVKDKCYMFNKRVFLVLLCLSTFSNVILERSCVHATELQDKNDLFNVDIDSYLYKTVNYNVDKFIKLASNKYGKNYWAYEAITTGNEWSSSIENLKKL